MDVGVADAVGVLAEVVGGGVEDDDAGVRHLGVLRVLIVAVVVALDASGAHADEFGLVIDAVVDVHMVGPVATEAVAAELGGAVLQIAHEGIVVGVVSVGDEVVGTR